MTDPVLILCMKWGTLYGARDVNNLARGVRRHLARPHRFICFTDDPSGLHPGIEALPLPDLLQRRYERLRSYGAYEAA